MVLWPFTLTVTVLNCNKVTHFVSSHIANTSVTYTLRRPYGGRRTPKSSDSCGCRRNSAVAAGPPYGESLCFTGRRGGRRIIARSYNFFSFLRSP